ncbi:MAG: hypothetical protein ACI9N1_000576 [Flavobacteriales bacterium]|jgi:hypothetical protein
MGKIGISHIIIVLMVLVSKSYGQDIVTSFGATGTNFHPVVSDSLTEIPIVSFQESGNEYSNFKLRGTPADNARSFSLGWESVLNYKKNMFYANLGAGFYSYSYKFTLRLKDSVSSKNEQSGRSDLDIWNAVNADANNVYSYGKEVKNIFQFKIGIGYGRSLLSWRGFEFSIQGKLGMIVRNDTDLSMRNHLMNGFSVRSAAGGMVKKLNVYLQPGFSIRKNANVLTFNSIYSINNINKDDGLSTYKEFGSSFSYYRIIGVNKLAKDQYIADSDFAVPEVKSKNYRKKDKSIYLQQLYGTSEFIAFQSASPDTLRALDPNLGNINIIVDGYKVSVSTPFGLSFNKYFTDRWMMGIQFGTYREIRSPYGAIEDTLGNFIGEVDIEKGKEFSLDNLPERAKSTTSGTFSITNAFYITKHTLKIDPFVQVSLKGVLLPSYSEFERRFEVLTDRQRWFSYVSVAVGGDLRIKIRNSRYLMLSGLAEYAFHPDSNYFNMGVRIGSYKKKKFKLKEY